MYQNSQEKMLSGIHELFHKGQKIMPEEEVHRILNDIHESF